MGFSNQNKNIFENNVYALFKIDNHENELDKFASKLRFKTKRFTCIQDFDIVNMSFQRYIVF